LREASRGSVGRLVGLDEDDVVTATVEWIAVSMPNHVARSRLDEDAGQAGSAASPVGDFHHAEVEAEVGAEAVREELLPVLYK
jgi:hypothetical protein